MKEQQWIDYVARKTDIWRLTPERKDHKGPVIGSDPQFKSSECKVCGGYFDGRPDWIFPFKGYPSGGPRLAKRECAVCGGPRHKKSWICATCWSATLLGYIKKDVVEYLVSNYRAASSVDPREVPVIDITSKSVSKYQGEQSQKIARGMRMNQDDELRPKHHPIDSIAIRNFPGAYDQRHRFAPCGRRFNLGKNFNWRDKSGLYFLRPNRTSQYKTLCGPPIKVDPIRLLNLTAIPKPTPMVPQFPPMQTCLDCSRALPGYWKWQGNDERLWGKCPRCIAMVKRIDAIRNADAKHRREAALMPEVNPMAGIINYAKFCQSKKSR